MKKFVLCGAWVDQDGPLAIIEADSVEDAVSKINGKILPEPMYRGGFRVSISSDLGKMLGKKSMYNDYYIVEVPYVFTA